MAGDEGTPTDGAVAPGRRRTGRLVRAIDAAATAGIVVGGQGVLVAMLAICVFLFVTAFPLLLPGSTGQETRAPLADERSGEAVHLSVLDGGLAMLVHPDGFTVYDRAGDRVLAAPAPAEGVTAFWTGIDPGEMMTGHDDGTIVRTEGVVQGRLVPESVLDTGRTLEAGVWTEPSESESQGLRARFGLSESVPIALLRDADGVRAWTLTAEPERPVRVGEGDGSVDLIASATGSARSAAMLARRADGTLALGSVRITRNLGGSGPPRRRVRWTTLEDAPAERPSWAFVAGDGSSVVLVWPDRVRWWSEGDATWRTATPTLTGATITAAAPAPGGRTVILGTDHGGVRMARVADGEEGQPPKLLVSRLLGDTGSPVTALGTRPDGRLVSVGYADGSAALVHATSHKLVTRVQTGNAPVRTVAHGPGGGSLWALGEDGTLCAWGVDPGYPEVSWRSLFTPVLYEGYDRPRFVYQSTGSSGAEAKFSIVPLVWGTLKATIVTMLISVPLGVLAAVYSSEFLHPSWRRTIKPAVELMATLPSVVIGFVAAMVVAPWVRAHLEAVLVGAVLVPVVLLVAASGWASMPLVVVRRMPGLAQLALIALVLLLGCALSAWLGGPIASAVLGDGGVSAWLEDDARPVWGAWWFLMLPVAATVFVFSRHIGAAVVHDVRRRRGFGVLVVFAAVAAASSLAHNGALAGVVANVGIAAGILGLCALRWSIADRGESALAHPARAQNIGRCLLAVGLTALAALAVAFVLQGIGADPRESLLGTYSQRNTLVVGVMMGFAVIPLIYTLSEDALRAVPGSLRAASYGSGATRWQTAVRVVLPVAGSGIFSACMIGLGRAVGETMIVLMATGSTPELDLNLFGGFRSLAANIAIELPEAPRGGTHYRVLFVCGLVLFLMTLLINTTAELVRQRFRKRSAAL